MEKAVPSPAAEARTSLAAGAPARPGFDPRDGTAARLGAAAGVGGLVLYVVMEVLHPSQVQPNDSAAAFREYAASDIWVVVHVGQFLAVWLLVLGLLAVARCVVPQHGLAGALGMVGAVTAILVAAVFAVQMAVDGVALKGAFDAWLRATEPGKDAAFQVADGVRWVEKALAAFFQILSGLTFLALGGSIGVGGPFPRWLGAVGVVVGAGFIAGGMLVAHTGFSPEASSVAAPTMVGLAVFVLGSSIVMWRRSPTAPRPQTLG